MRLLALIKTSLLLGVMLGGIHARAGDHPEPADYLFLEAKVVTAGPGFPVHQAVAVRGDRIVAVGKDADLAAFRGPSTVTIRCQGALILPGLYDNQVHSYEASVTELTNSSPRFPSLDAALGFIRQQAATNKPGTWIRIDHAYPTRLKECRLPTLEELDDASTNCPIQWDAGQVCMINTKAMEVSGITNATRNPPGGEIVRDPVTLKATGLLRKANGILKTPPPPKAPSVEERRQALRHLYSLYNEQGITSIGEQDCDSEALALFRDMATNSELTVRLNCTRLLKLGTNTDESLLNLKALTNGPGNSQSGPTGRGDEWVHIGPLKTVMDGDLLTGTAYLRTPWGIGPTYQITEPADRGLLFQDQDVLTDTYLAAARGGWQLTSQCAGDGAVDVLLRTYKRIQLKTNISTRRFLITQGGFQIEQNWDHCQELGLCAMLQPMSLYEDGHSLQTGLGAHRMRFFLPLRTWVEQGIRIGGGSDHRFGLDPANSINPYSPWLGMWVVLTRQSRQGTIVNAAESISREEAIRFYTINNAYLNFEDSFKGSLEVGKLADLIVIDKDILKCPVDDIPKTKVVLTMVGGKMVWQAQ